MGTPTLKMLLLGEDKSASKALKGVGEQAEQTQKKVSSFGKIAKGVFAGMVVRDAVEKSVDFLKDSAEAAAEDEAAQRRLGVALHNTVGATKEQTAHVGELLAKMSEQYGVSKDDLMPAYQRLAESSGSLSKAHRELKIAMDVSAGTGKNLNTVTGAMMKANNGTVASLSRLGLKTKDANGKTLSLKQSMKAMADTFHGQAEARADSLQGTMDRLHETFHETEVQVGEKILPTFARLSQWFLDKGVPAIQAVVTEVAQALTPAFDRVKTAVQNLQPFLQAVGNFLQKNPKTVQAFAVALTAMGAALLVVTTAMKALDIVMAMFDAEAEANPIGAIVLALAALAAGLQYAYTHSEKFRAITQAAFGAVKVAAHAAAATIEGLASTFGRVKSAASSVIGWVRSHWVLLAGILTGPVGLAVAEIISHFGAIKGAVSSAIGKVIAIFKGLPGRISGAVGNLGGILTGAGKAVIDGLISGIESGVGKLTGVLHKITSLIPKHKGPHNKDKVLLTPAGKAIMDGLIKGIESKRKPLKDVLGKVTDDVSKTGDKVKAAADKLAQDKQSASDFAGGFSSFSSSVFGADYGTDLLGNPVAPTVSSILGKAGSEKTASASLAANVKKLVGLGLSPDLLQQMQSAGSSGLAEINALASSASKGQIKQLNSLNASTYANDRAAGTAAAGTIYGKQIRTDEHNLTVAQRADIQAKALEKALHGLNVKGGDVYVVLDGKTIKASVAKTDRKQGKGK